MSDGLGVWLAACVALTVPTFVEAQLGGGVESGDRIEGRAKLFPIPYVGYDRSFGWALGGIPMVLFNPVAADTVSPSSVAGAFGMYTRNKTWAVGAFSALFLDEDRWRVTAGGGTASVNFQFYLDSPVEAWVPYNSASDFAVLSVDRRVSSGIYLGLGYAYTGFVTSAAELGAAPATSLHGLSMAGSWDRRSSVRYPRSGFLAEATLTTYPGWLGNADAASVAELEHNHYAPVRDGRDVVAGRAYAGVGLGGVSFNQQFIVGGTDIRGYSQGKYRGDNILAVQAEYRWNVLPRLGLVGFLGSAWVFEAVSAAHGGRILPGVGAGVRFTADTETHLNLGIDVAFGRDDWSFSFRFGEAF